MAAVLQVLDVNRNPVVPGRKYTVTVRPPPFQITEADRRRRDEIMNMEGTNGRVIFTATRVQADRDGIVVQATRDDDGRQSWLSDQNIFRPVVEDEQDGGRRKSRRKSRRLRRSRRFRR